MKVQFLNGGLANQTFQYIFTRFYELSHPGEIMYMDDSYFALNTVHNGYELEKVFGVKPHMLSECFDADVWRYILEERKLGKSVPQILCENEIPMYMISEVGAGHNTFNPFEGMVITTPCNKYNPLVLEYEGDVYYHGYWINKLWFAGFEEELRKELQFPEITDARNLAYQEQILNSNSVAIHIRRGDYVTLGAAVAAKSYDGWIKHFLTDAPGEWNAFIFSDDIPWCKENAEEMGFGHFSKVTYVEGNMHGENYRDLQLMSMCKGMILSNSAFSYLAALLNTRKEHWLNCTPREV